MPFPKKDEIEVATLLELEAMGGEATTRQIYQRVAQRFPQLSQDELAQKLKSGDKKWPNLVRWARLALVQKGEVTSSGRGVWKITEKGRERVGKKT